MPGYQSDIGLAVKKYVGEFAADLAGRSGYCNPHKVFSLPCKMCRLCLSLQKKAAAYRSRTADPSAALGMTEGSCRLSVVGFQKPNQHLLRVLCVGACPERSRRVVKTILNFNFDELRLWLRMSAADRKLIANR